MVTKQNKFLLFFIVLLMVAAIFIIQISISSDQDEAHITTTLEGSALETEEAVFERSAKALDYVEMRSVESQKSIEEYYKNRAFDGGPPVIPHEILGKDEIGGKSCLQCHQNGGYVDRFKAYAPVTPHPDFVNCRQCHVPAQTKSLFVKSNFKKVKVSDDHYQALPGSPPAIPHSLQLRDNCLACHAGPSAPKEIRVSHPERVNCRQCHAAPQSEDIQWVRNSNNTIP